MTETARFRVQLLSGDPELMHLADAVFEAVGALRDTPDTTELVAAEGHFEVTLRAFIGVAAARLPATSFRPVQRSELPGLSGYK